MSKGDVLGSVAELWRFPVKSMQGESLAQAWLEEGGLRGDRAQALIDTATGKVASAKSVRSFPSLLDCRATSGEEPREAPDSSAVTIALPGGVQVRSDAEDADDILSKHFGRQVRLARTAPADYVIDQYHPDVAGVDPSDRRDVLVEQKLGASFFEELGVDSPVPHGVFFDAFPLSLMTTSTLESLRRHEPATGPDSRRFRMNVIVATEEEGFPENEWVGCSLAIGETVRITVAMPDPRCVMTTLAQGDLPAESGVLRAMVRENRIPVGDGDLLPCAGVYAVIEAGGTIRVGDPVMRLA